MRLTNFYSYDGALYKFRVYRGVRGWTAKVQVSGNRMDGRRYLAWSSVIHPQGGTVRHKTKRAMKEYLEYGYGEKF